MGSTYNALTEALMLEENSTYPNNPGAIMNPASGFQLQFPNLQAGIDALNNQVNYDMSGGSSIYSPNETLAEYESTYTGGNPNAASNVASMLGVSPNTPVGALSDQAITPPTSFLQRIQNWFSNAYGNPDLAANAGGVAGLGGGTLTQNAATAGQQTGSKLSSIAVDAVCILLGLILVAISVFGLSKVQETAIGVAKVAAA